MMKGAGYAYWRIDKKARETVFSVEFFPPKEKEKWNDFFRLWKR